MASSGDCSKNVDSLKLVREGTSQEQRLSPALDPAWAPVDEHLPEHGMVFAQAYSTYLKYFNSSNVHEGDWEPFFSEDVSVQLATAAIQDVGYYRRQVKEYFDFLNNRQNTNDIPGLRDRLDYLFSCCSTLSLRLNQLAEKLPADITLKQSLRNQVQSQLAPALRRLVAYHKGGEAIDGDESPLNGSNDEKSAPLKVLGRNTVPFSSLREANLSKDWTDGQDWTGYYDNIEADNSVYGTPLGPTVFDRINHLATHNLFSSILENFLKAYARTISDARSSLEETLKNWDRHEPHYALFLAYLRLFEYARAEANTLTARHLDFYYRDILQLKEKSAEPSHAHLLVELAKHAPMHVLESGEMFKAGKDDGGREAFFSQDRDFVANQAKVAALKTVYRHGKEFVGDGENKSEHLGRLFASPIANSEDGLGEELRLTDQSWHPFYNKRYQDGVLDEIHMPFAEVGFAIASHYLYMAEGTRTVSIQINVRGATVPKSSDYSGEILCLMTTADGWIEQDPEKFTWRSANRLEFDVTLPGDIPAIVPYDAKVHGYSFDTNLPVLIVKLKHTASVKYAYPFFKDVIVENIQLNVSVEHLQTLAISNDFGPVDSSKPFQPFGPSPKAKSSLIIGSTEAFQKTLSSAAINISWQSPPNPYGNNIVRVNTEYLQNGIWESSGGDSQEITQNGGDAPFQFSLDFTKHNPFIGVPDFSGLALYNTKSRSGFIRLETDADFGQSDYEEDLIDYLKKVLDGDDATKPIPPVGPFISRLTMNYTTDQQAIVLQNRDAVAFKKRQARFFHLTPFGQAEQHPALSHDSQVFLFPHLKNEAELYIGLIGLKPPQNVSLLFQVVDGTADPQIQKPAPHIHWSYMKNNEWVAFDKSGVEDQTDELLNSGVVTFSIPRDASDTNTLWPFGMYWIRAAVDSGSNAVCRLILIGAQAVKATFTDNDNDPAFSGAVLPSGTINKLKNPVPAIKSITQAFATFGGRGKELPTAFYTRVSERLRHKDRAITVWDYERLVLEAFPQIYKVKCLNHTHYEQNESGTGIYKELAPGHVTIITLPNLQFQKLRDPLRPFTSLGLLEEIHRYLRKRTSCFLKLHVKNPEFEEVRVACKIRLNDGLDETFYKKKLQEDLTRFLSPWAFPGGNGPSFVGAVNRSVLLNFVEEQSYVDYLTDFQLFHIFSDNNGKHTVEKHEVEGSKALSIVGSVPAKNHVVEFISAAENETVSEICPCDV